MRGLMVQRPLEGAEVWTLSRQSLTFPGARGLSPLTGGQSAPGNGVVPFPQVRRLLCQCSWALSRDLTHTLCAAVSLGGSAVPHLSRPGQPLASCGSTDEPQQHSTSQGRGPRQTGRHAGPGLPTGLCWLTLRILKFHRRPACGPFSGPVLAEGGGPAGLCSCAQPSFHLPIPGPHG